MALGNATLGNATLAARSSVAFTVAPTVLAGFTINQLSGVWVNGFGAGVISTIGLLDFGRGFMRATTRGSKR